MHTQSIICPQCCSPVTLNNKVLICTNNHSFDQAKQGYFNLLLPQHKRSKYPGDNLEMVKARQKFLNTDIYLPISQRLNKISLQILRQPVTDIKKVLDIGCGEGYYTNQLANELSSINELLEVTGLDISKEAIKYAAKRNKDVLWLVASGAQIPLQAKSQDLVTCLFTRLLPEGMFQVIKESGALIVVSTGSSHLIELRKLIYDRIEQEALQPETDLSFYFIKASEERLSYSHTLQSQQEIQDLFMMTPHYWRTSKSSRESLSRVNTLDITIDIRFTIFKPKSSK